jgi:uncharacterized phage protein (TIGR01671 family)
VWFNELLLVSAFECAAVLTAARSSERIMREIKFRTWGTYSKQMMATFTPLDYDFEMPNFQQDVVFMQFTDLHDKKGKEIYEGDLVRAWAKTEWGSRAWSLAEVEWGATHGQWYFTVHEHESGAHVGSESWGAVKFLVDTPNGLQLDMEVIGNIHENPELLK